MRATCVALGLAALFTVMPAAIAQDERDDASPGTGPARTRADEPQREVQSVEQEKKEVEQMADAAL